MADNNGPIVIEQIFDTSVNIVWNAITQVDQMRLWFFDNIEEFRPEVGFQTEFKVQSQDRDFLHLWKLTEVVPMNRIVYNWRYGGYSGESFVIFELLELGNKTKLKLTAVGMDSFPDDIPEFSRESCIGGWKYFIKNRLREFLKKRTK